MLNPKNDNKRDFSYLDRLSTEELREIIRQDYMLDQDNETDMEAILYIMEVLARREKEENTDKPDVEAAWDEFQKEYYPYSDDPAPLYSLGGDDIAPAKQPKRFRHLIRTAGIAAAIVALLLSGTVAANAFGYDILGKFTAWTHETFGFTSNKDDMPPFKNLQVAMKMKNVEATGIPSWLPAGYGEDIVQVSDIPDGVYFVSTCKGQGWEISLNISVYMHTETDVRKYEGEEKNVKIYESAGVNYYITSNGGFNRVTWSNSNAECSILCDLPEHDLYAVIDSISDKGL